MSELVRRRLLISGAVQGVFYRVSAQREAVALGISGWARNLADGRVEVLVQGDPTAVEAMTEWCQNGSPNAQVDAVEVTDEAVSGVSGFLVR